MESGFNLHNSTRTWAMKAPTSTRERVLKLWNDNRSDTTYALVVFWHAVDTDGAETRLVDEVAEVQDESDIDEVTPAWGGSDVGTARASSGERSNAYDSSTSLQESPESSASRVSWLFKLPPRRSSQTRSTTTEYTDEPQNIIYEDMQAQTDEKERVGSSASHPTAKHSLREAMTVITLGRKNSTSEPDLGI